MAAVGDGDHAIAQEMGSFANTGRRGRLNRVPNHVPNSAETTPQNPIKPERTPSNHGQKPCK